MNEMLLELQYFHYDMSLYLNMGHYHLSISVDASNLYTINLSQGKYLY